MLDYENQIFLDAFHSDGLLIMSRGLGLTRIFAEFLRVYSDPACLVLVLNSTPSDDNFFTEQLEKMGVARGARVITNEVNANERQRTYMEGGVLFITSRILVVDLLTDRVPLDHVTGILVYRAHKIIESCQEAFILRLFRQKNKTGFIKAFTDFADAFTSGFCQVERMMKNLFVKKLFLWPRFQAGVVSCFNSHRVDVVEVHAQLTPAMAACQTCLLELINACVTELTRGNPTLDLGEITVENALSRNFERVIRLQLDPVWHTLSQRTRNMVSDLKTLRLILHNLTQYDCVTFYSLVQSIRTSERAFGKNTGWLFLDSADSLFVHAKERVYGSAKKQGKGNKKGKKEEEEEEEDSDDDTTTTKLEPCPKWLALHQVLEEIQHDEETVCEVGVDSSGALDQGYRVLICAEDDRTCSQIKEFLAEGCDSLLNRLFKKYIILKKQRYAANNERSFRKTDNKDQQQQQQGGKKPTKSLTASIKEDALTLTQMIAAEKDNDDTDKNTRYNDAALCNLTSKDAYFNVVRSPLTVIHPVHGCTDPHGMTRTLEEVEPKYVVLYDADMSLVRQLEVFKASRPGKPLRVYFMMYQGSVEEQRYLTSLRKEKEAFEYLIREKSTMVISEEQDGLSEDDPNLMRGSQVTEGSKSASGVSSRKGGTEGASANPSRQMVIVDMREFRSELPSLIHRRGIDIEPVTIDVGDYILTPDVCVERKSISDLIGSLNSGRLYQQALAMSRFYKRPMLLIEFDANKPFSLQIKSQLSSDISVTDVTTRLAMLTMHFPKLRLLWCASPYASAELFEELKVGRGQPSVAEAQAVKAAGADVPQWNDKYNHGPQDFVLRLPGVTSKNFHGLLNKFRDLHEVCQASEAELAQALGGNAPATRLYNFFHKEHKPESVTEAALDKKAGGRFKKGRGFMGKGRGVKRKN